MGLVYLAIPPCSQCRLLVTMGIQRESPTCLWSIKDNPFEVEYGSMCEA